MGHKSYLVHMKTALVRYTSQTWSLCFVHSSWHYLGTVLWNCAVENNRFKQEVLCLLPTVQVKLKTGYVSAYVRYFALCKLSSLVYKSALIVIDTDIPPWNIVDAIQIVVLSFLGSIIICLLVMINLAEFSMVFAFCFCQTLHIAYH